MNKIQKLIFLLEPYIQGTTLNTISGYSHIQGRIEVAIFEKALQLLAKKHPALRSQMSENDKIQITEQADTNLTYFPQIENTAELIQQLSQQPISLYDTALWRNYLFYPAENETIWLLQIHHFIADGWAVSQIFRQVSTFYTQLLADPTYDIAFTLPKETFPLPNAADKVFWQGQNIPFLPPQTQQLHPTARFYLPLNKKYWVKLQQFCDYHRIDLSHLFSSILKIYFYRTAEKQQFLMGMPVLNRSGREQRAVVDLFVNFLPLSFEIEEDDSALAVILRAKTFILNLYRHQSYPLLTLLEDLQQENKSANKLFNVLFSYEKHGYGNTFANYEAQPTFLPHTADDNFLTFHLMEYQNSGDIQLAIDFATDVFSKEKMVCMIDNWQSALFQIVKNTEIPVKKIQWTRGIKMPFHSPFFQIKNAALNFLKMALVFQEKSMNYGELYRKAFCFAMYLRKKAKQKTVISFSFSRGFDTIIALLGCFVGNYTALILPEDISEERKKKLQENSKVALHVSEEIFKKEVHNISHLLENIPDFEVKPDDTIAYHVYTSGSTGEPKGVAISQRNLAHITADWQQMYQLQDAVVLQLCAYTFDVFIGDICRSILLNQTLILTDEEERLSPNKILSLIEKHQVTHVETTPVMSNLICQNIENQNLNSLKYYIVGSDKFLTSNYFNLKLKLPKHTHIVNSYGLSECTIDSSCWINENDDLLITEKLVYLPIGKVFYSQQIFILDRFLQIQPYYVEGEMYIGGQGLGAFLQEIDNERFIFHEQFGKLYKTGDFAYLHPNLGFILTERKDRQVKINAYRIDLGEVEVAIKRVLPEHQVAVVAQQNVVAFIAPPLKTTENEWFIALKKFLPVYALPKQVIPLPVLPLNTNGKIDYQSLSAWQIPENQQLVPPNTAAEKTLLAILEELLKAENMGIQHNFYEIGGHSLIAVQAKARLKAENYELDLVAFFECETLEELASKMKYITENTLQIDENTDYMANLSEEEMGDILNMLGD
ncbi:MAG: condensation domain-containing protein [Bacteroidia bacterium]